MIKRIAKIKHTMLGFEDHDFFTVGLDVEYGRDYGGGQTIGLLVLGVQQDPGKNEWNHDIRPTKGGCEFIMRVLNACGVRKWESLVGRTIYVLFKDEKNGTMPCGIENLETEPGEQFLFDEFQARSKYECGVEAELLKAGKLDLNKWLPGWKHS